MVKQDGKYYWDLEGVYTYLPSVCDSIKLLRFEGIMEDEDAKKMTREELVKVIRDKFNNGWRYMEVPNYITASRI